MNILAKWAATTGWACLAFVVAGTAAAHADSRRAVQTETGILIADYRPGNVPPENAVAVAPGDAWAGWIELDSDQDVKFYVANPGAGPDDRPWRHYRAYWFRCGDASDDEGFVTITVDAGGLAVVRCR
jgi:hypothetical protein